jgi:hypothetical protein
MQAALHAKSNVSSVDVSGRHTQLKRLRRIVVGDIAESVKRSTSIGKRGVASQTWEAVARTTDKCAREGIPWAATSPAAVAVGRIENRDDRNCRKPA